MFFLKTTAYSATIMIILVFTFTLTKNPLKGTIKEIMYSNFFELKLIRINWVLSLLIFKITESF